MAKITIYTTKGTKKSEVTTPKVLTLDVDSKFLAQVLRVYEANSHTGFSRTKTRADINKTKKKLYKQKGTGGARHGAKSAPIFVGGGIAHGPKIEKRSFKVSTKMKKVAKFMALSLKAKDGKLVFVENLSKVKKTKEFAKFLNKIMDDGKTKKAVVVYGKESKFVSKGVANIQNINAVTFEKVNAFDLIQGRFVVMEEGLI